MNINDLPSDILSLVLKNTVGGQAQGMKNWKSSIQLMAVCRKWRIIAAPWVHYWAFVECHDASEDEYASDTNETTTAAITYNISGQDTESYPLNIDSEGNDLDEAQPNDQDVNNTVWVTNVDFHKACGSISSVRKLNIYLATNIPLVLFLRKVSAFLELSSIQWSGIKYLLIEIFSMPAEIVEIDEDIDSQTAEIESIAHLIKQNMNNVNKLIIDNHPMQSSNEVTVAFGNKLVNAYSDQLVKISSNLNAQLTAPVLSTQLKHIKLFLDSSVTLKNIHIPTESLEYMFFINAPLEFPWKIFHKNKGDTNIDMSHLKFLAMIFSFYRQTSNANFYQPAEDAKLQSALRNARPKLTLSLPNIKTLRLEYPPPSCPIFYSFPELQCLSNLHLTAPFVSLQQVRHMKIKSVDNMYIYLDSVSANHKAAFYETTNYLFGDISIGGESEFNIRTRLPFKVDVDKVKWDNLQTLDLSGIIEFSTLLKLIERLKKLKSLIFRNITISSFIEDVGYIDSPRWKMLLESPLKTNISIIGALGKHRQQSTHCISNIIYFLIQRIRSLEKAYIMRKQFKNQIDALLKQSPKPHPNIHSIICIDED